MKRISLNLDGENLWVFEPFVKRAFVEDIKKGILEGRTFPPVDVVEREEGVYEICYGKRLRDSMTSILERRLPFKTFLRRFSFLNDLEFLDEDFHNYNYGGHHRAAAHYQLGAPMDCRVLKDHRSAYWAIEEFIPLKDLRVVEDLYL